MTEWQIAKCKPRQETWLSSSLASLGVEVFFPRIARIRHGKQSIEPLFPTYLFCRLDTSSLDRPTVRWAPGLDYFVNHGLPNGVLDELVAYVQHGVALWNNGAYPTETGEHANGVEASPGQFAGLEGVFCRYVTSRKRCRMLIQTVGKLAEAEVKRRALQVAEP